MLPFVVFTLVAVATLVAMRTIYCLGHAAGLRRAEPLINAAANHARELAEQHTNSAMETQRKHFNGILDAQREFFQGQQAEMHKSHNRRFQRIQEELEKAYNESDDTWYDYAQATESLLWSRMQTKRTRVQLREQSKYVEALEFKLALAQRTHLKTIGALRDMLTLYKNLEHRFGHLLDQHDMLARRNTEATFREVEAMEREQELTFKLREAFALLSDAEQRTKTLEQELATERDLSRDAEKYASYLNSELADARAVVADNDETIQRLSFEVASLAHDVEQAQFDNALHRSRWQEAQHKADDYQHALAVVDYEFDTETAALRRELDELRGINAQLGAKLAAAFERGDQWSELAQAAQERADDLYHRLDVSERQRKLTHGLLQELKREAALQSLSVERIFNEVKSLGDQELHDLVNRVVQPELLTRPFFHRGQIAPHQTPAADA